MRDEELDVPPAVVKLVRNEGSTPDQRLNRQVIAAIIAKTRAAWATPATAPASVTAPAVNRPRLVRPYSLSVAEAEDLAS